MRWLAFVLVSCVTYTASSGSNAQKPAPVIGLLTTAAPASRGGEQLTAFFSGLREAGFVEGQNVRIEYRWANDDYVLLRKMAKELVDLKVSVIVAAGGHVSAMAAHEATSDIPISFTTVTDPIKMGLVKNYNKSGTNATGTAGLTSELDPKRLEFLREVKPTTALVGVLVNPNRPGLEAKSIELQAAAEKMGVKLEVQKGATDEQIEDAFRAFSASGVDGVLVTADPLFNNHRAQVLSLARSLPAIYQWREFVLGGGLMSYGPSITEAYYKAGVNAGLMLKGAKPGDIPVEQPTKFQLTINRKTASQLGLTIPTDLLAVANEVIE